MNSFIVKILGFFVFAFALGACKIYSFTGTNLAKELKTFSVQNFALSTAGGPQNMSLSMTEKLKEYYQRNTSLKLKPNDGDLSIGGTFIGYELSPVAATSSDKGAMNRLTITVEITFRNRLNEDENFEKEFSFYQDYSQTQTLSDVESKLVPIILDQLVTNIFNQTAATW